MIRQGWRQRPFLTLAFVVAVLATLFFAGRALTFAVTLSYRAEQPVAGWMTPRYIARTYGLDRDAIAALLGTEDRDDLRQPIDAIAREQARPAADLIAIVQTAVDAQDAGE